MVDQKKWYNRIVRFENFILSIRKSSLFTILAIILAGFGVWSTLNFIFVDAGMQSHSHNCIVDAIYTHVTELELKNCLNDVDIKLFFTSYYTPLLFFFTSTIIGLLKKH